MKSFLIFTTTIHILIFLVVSGCTHKPVTPAFNKEAVQLSPQAKASFFYLKFQDLKKQGKANQALEALNKAIDKDSSPELYLEKALFFWSNDRFEKTRASLEKGLELFPKNKQMTLTLARFYIHQNQSDQALKLLRDYNKIHPDHKQAIALMANLYLKKQQFSQAIDILQTLPSQDKTAKIHYLIGQAYAHLKDHNRAIKHFQQATSKNPLLTKAWTDLAYEYEKTKNYVQAEKTYRKLLNQQPDNIDILLRLIDLNIKLNKLETALDFVKKGPKNTSFLLRATALFMQQGFYDQANSILNLIAKDDLDKAKALFFRAISALKTEDKPDKALNLLQQIPEQTYLYPRALSLKAQIYSQKGSKEKALNLVRQGHKKFPENASFWVLESEILNSQKKYQQSMALLTNALDLLPKNINILFQAGITAHHLGKKEQALDYMERLISFNPDYAPALNFIGYTLIEQGQNFVRAKILLEKALKMEPQNGYFLDSLAWWYFKHGKLDKAWETIKQAVDQVKDDPIIWEHFGDIAHGLKKREKAHRAYKRALDLETDHSKRVQKKLNNL